jgi:hypothetical protein
MVAFPVPEMDGTLGSLPQAASPNTSTRNEDANNNFFILVFSSLFLKLFYINPEGLYKVENTQSCSCGICGVLLYKIPYLSTYYKFFYLLFEIKAFSFIILIRLNPMALR